MKGKMEVIIRDGQGRVVVKTLHGQFEFRWQKYLQDGRSRSYFELSEQFEDGYVSRRLQEMSAYYSNRMIREHQICDFFEKSQI
jgi:hypothetical protein